MESGQWSGGAPSIAAFSHAPPRTNGHEIGTTRGAVDEAPRKILVALDGMSGDHQAVTKLVEIPNCGRCRPDSRSSATKRVTARQTASCFTPKHRRGRATASAKEHQLINATHPSNRDLTQASLATFYNYEYDTPPAIAGVVAGQCPYVSGACSQRT